MLPKKDPEKFDIKPEALVYDAVDHRITSDGSGLVSTTVSVPTAHKFAAMFSQDSEQTQYTVYSAKVKGSMSPSPTVCPDQKEYSAVDGIPTKDILAYRKCKTDGQTSKCSSVFFNKQFLKKHPELAESIAQSQLFEGESLKFPCDNWKS